jgi:hypothetical protein
MTASSNEQVVFRDYPLLLWLFGVAFIVPAPIGITERLTVFLVLALVGIGMIAVATILTVTVDHGRGMLHLHYRSLVRGSTKAYPLSEIGFVNVAQDREGERMYRLELILRSGEAVPLRGSYEGGKRRLERQAQRLRSVLGRI